MWQLADVVIVRTGTSSRVCTVVSLFSSVSFEIKRPDLNKLQRQTLKSFLCTLGPKLQHPKKQTKLATFRFWQVILPPQVTQDNTH